MATTNSTYRIHYKKYFILTLAIAVKGLSAQEGLTAYSIQAKVVKSRPAILEVEEEIFFTNPSNQPLGEIPIVLYPNRFKRELPNLNDLNYRQLYPNGYSKGEVVVKTLTVDGAAANLEEYPAKFYPAETLKKIRLATPLLPSKTVRVCLSLAVKVPKKYGSFGWFRNKISLSGAWYAYVPAFDAQKGFLFEALPSRAKWTVDIAAPQSHALVGGRYFSKGEPIHLGPVVARQVSVFLDSQEKVDVRRISGRQRQVQLVIDAKEPESVKNSLEELSVRWLDFAEAIVPGHAQVEPLTLVQAPVREALVKQGEKISYVSDRAFKLIDSLAQYHTAPIVSGLFYQLFFDHVSRLEDSENYDVILEVLSWYWTEKFMQYTQYLNRDARNIKAVRLFSFMPVIDQLIYSPQFAFVDTFYDSIYPYDPVRDDTLRFNHQRSRGRTLYAHLEDEIGVEQLNRFIEEYMGSNQSFFKVVQSHQKDDFRKKFEQWLAPVVPVNYSLGKRETKRTPDGFENEITIKKRVSAKAMGQENAPQLVELGIVTKKGDPSLYSHKWEPSEKEHVFRFTTKDPLKVIELDPRKRLYETDLSDNRDPAKYKFILTQAILNYDFNQSQPELFVTGQFRKTYGGYNRYDAGVTYFSDSYGFQLGYTRLFGRLIDRLRLAHGVSLLYQFNHVSQDNIVVRDASLPKAVLVPVTGTSNLTSITLSYFTGNQLSLTNPLSGGYGSIGATLGANELGGDHDYYSFGLGGSWLWRLFENSNHLFAVRGELGISGPDAMPTQAYSRLGGTFGMRGISFSDYRFRGRNILLTSAEYRHFLNPDMDINLGLFRIRAIQGALFADAGQVTDTVQEKAERIALGAGASRTGISDLFKVSKMETDVGYGVRFHVEYLGVNPALLRFDVARSLTEASAPLRYYFGVTQSF